MTNRPDHPFLFRFIHFKAKNEISVMNLKNNFQHRS